MLYKKNLIWKAKFDLLQIDPTITPMHPKILTLAPLETRT